MEENDLSVYRNKELRDMLMDEKFMRGCLKSPFFVIKSTYYVKRYSAKHIEKYPFWTSSTRKQKVLRLNQYLSAVLENTTLCDCQEYHRIWSDPKNA